MTDTIPYIDETDKVVHHCFIDLYEVYDWQKVTADDICQQTGFAMPVVVESIYHLQKSGIVGGAINGAYYRVANNGYYPLEEGTHE